MLVLSIAAFLTITWTTLKGVPSDLASQQWHFCPATSDPSNATSGGDPAIVQNGTSNDLEFKNDAAPVVKDNSPYHFRPSPNAFVFYATTNEYACSVLVNIHRLKQKFYTRHRVHVLLSRDVSTSYLTAIVEAGASLTIRDPPPLAAGSAFYYKDCLLKLMAFGLHQIDETIERIAVLDADQLILQNLDHIFDLPQADIAAPRADWIGQDVIASTFMVISLSDRLWETVKLGMGSIKENHYDMDLVNDLFSKKVLLLPSNYVALNGLWHSWIVPDWYRPEEADNDERIPLTDEEKKWQGESFWRALSIMNDADPFAKDVKEEQPEEEYQQKEKQHGPTGLRIKREPKGAITLGLEPPKVSSSTSTSEPPSTTTEKPSSLTSDREDGGKDQPSQTSPTSSPTPYHPPIDPLLTLYKHNAKILHFTYGGKPWSSTIEELSVKEPGGHPLYYEQYATWRKEAKHICPPVMKKKTIATANGKAIAREVLAGIVEVI